MIFLIFTGDVESGSTLHFIAQSMTQCCIIQTGILVGKSQRTLNFVTISVNYLTFCIC
jgi:hypothetical protein